MKTVKKLSKTYLEFLDSVLVPQNSNMSQKDTQKTDVKNEEDERSVDPAAAAVNVENSQVQSGNGAATVVPPAADPKGKADKPSDLSQKKKKSFWEDLNRDEKNLAAFLYDTPNLIEALGEELDSTLEKLAENPRMQQVYIFTRKKLENEQEVARLNQDMKEAGEALKAERALYEEGLFTPTDTETIMDDAELEERLDKIRIRASPQEREWTPISGRKEYQNRARKLAHPVKKFTNAVAAAEKDFQKNDERISKEQGQWHLAQVEEYYKQLETLRSHVVEPLTVQEQIDDQFLEKYYSLYVNVRNQFDERFVIRSNSGSSRAKSSFSQSAHEEAIKLQELAAMKEKQKQEEKGQPLDLDVENVRKEALAAARKVEAAKREAMERKEKVRKQFEREQAEIDLELQQLDRGFKPITPAPSVHSAFVAPPKGPSVLHQPSPALSMTSSVYQVDGAIKTPLPEKSVVQEDDFKSFMKQMIGQIGSNSFNIEDYVDVFDGGSYAEYALWKAAWASADKKMTELNKTNMEKYRILLRCLGAAEKKIVLTDHPNENSYETALKSLDEVYHNPQLYLRELTSSLSSMPAMADSKESLQTGFTTLKNAWENFEARNMAPEHLSFLYFLAQNESKLSPNAMKIWNSKKYKYRDPNHPLGSDINITHFFNAIDEAKANAVSNQFVKNQKAKKEKDKEDKEDKKNKASSVNGPNTYGTGAGNNAPPQIQYPGDGINCPIPKCGQKAHKFLIKCPELPKMTGYKVFRWVKDNKVKCLKCFGTCHGPDDCPTSLKNCEIIMENGAKAGKPCGKAHNRFVHYDPKPKVQTNSTGNNTQQGGQQPPNNGDPPPQGPPPPRS